MPTLKGRWPGKFVLGITGGIASGKSTVLQALRRRGLAVASSDELSHACIRRGQPAYRAIIKIFSPAVLDRNKEIDRSALARIVFRDPAARHRLERLVHPCVTRTLERFVKRHRGLIALDIPLLFEARREHLVDRSILVVATQAQQIRRLRTKRGMSHADALRRIRAQMPLREKRRRADLVLDNRSSRGALNRQITALLKTLPYSR